ncbi:hypothetical protein BV25DRAFT_1868215 [Artomyces pyxidatus]|uniref:Uncharacterized protein n=1 Tax=Artomyces pyxidatus TaxID=48021 RepID=A0ACB8TDN7_9AGAM|nr:hypothetical protein BV25DRAFT_1868215 [Artomyces pyxidatus]
MKDSKGVINENSREMVRELANLGLPMEHASAAIHTVLGGAGMEVEGSISRRSSGRIVHEGGVASMMQIGHEIRHSGSFTALGDGAQHKHINYESRHILIRPLRFLGIHSAVDHTSESQLNGWKQSFMDICALYNSSPLGKCTPLDLAHVAARLKGLMSDHAEDQKKLFRLLEEWKIRIDRVSRGEEAVLAMSPPELVHTIYRANEMKIAEAGGIAAWDALSAAQQKAQNNHVWEQIYMALGSDAYAALSDDKKREVNLFIWAGCGMHKEMNSVKGGNKRMVAFWLQAGLVPPIKLMNRDNAAAASGGTSAAQSRAAEVSEGGGVKVTSLAGAIFNHKDDKKGQQDTLRIYLESVIGFMSHCEAAAELLVHLDLYIDFLDLVRDKKDTRTFNHMENNVYKALHDIPTLTELASISHPYMRTIRGSPTGTLNALDLGPFHEKVKEHCRLIIADPDLLLSSSTSYETGSLDGKPWERPEAVYAVLRRIPQLPHIRGALVAFFEGALETWERFTSEFAPGGKIAQTTAAERELAFILPTNDPSEGGVGGFRIETRQSPNKSLTTINAQMMYKQNGTATWMRETLAPEDHAFLRKAVRAADEAGLGRKMREEQAENDKRVVAEKREKDAVRVEKVAAANAVLDGLELKLDEDWWKNSDNSKKVTVAQIDMQLAWHRRSEGLQLQKGEKPVIPKKTREVWRRPDSGGTMVAAQ